MTKRKLYWTLTVPFLLMFLLLLVFLPDEYKNYSLFLLIPFWIVYYTLLAFLEKPSEEK